VAACPACGKENPDGFQFCGFCTAPLTEQTVSPALEERKVVSVLFCDLVGFTAASEGADPEDVRARIRPYHESLRHELERYGGTVEKFIGDAVMAVFGAPVAHEDDPERAVRAGLRILEAIGELNEHEPELQLQVRVGIATGEAIVSLHARPEEGEGIVVGDVVNTAARIQTAAPVNGVAVGDETFGQTERVFVYEPLAPVEVKGKSEPLRMYRALEARARFGADLIRTTETPFVGREVEKTLLQGLFDRCARDSSFELVTLVGEPGVGKSRLCAELFRFIDERTELIRWRQGRCLPYGEGIMFWALGEIVKSHAGVFESDSPEAAAEKLERVLPDVEEREWLKARLLPLLGIDSGQSASRDESFSAWRRFVESIASNGPAVVVVEDLHWADAAMLDFLSHLAEWAEGVPLLLVCTARPELFETHSTWGAGTRNSHTINLSPLSESETSELVQGLLEQTVSEQVHLAILERAGGNPLYAEEFVRLVADRGLGEPGDGLAFPDSVQALIAARLDTLSEERKSLLQDAAVVGKVFWAGALASMREQDERDIELALHELSRKELVRPARRTSMEGETEYAFWHVLVRDVAYGQIPRAVRARKHGAAAAWVEAKAGARVEDLADVLAYHYQEALELARATGDVEAVRELLPAARKMLVLAGDRAAALDQAAADAFYRRALSLYEGSDATQAPLLLKAGRSAAMLSATQAEEDAHRAAELYLSVGDELGAAEGLLDLTRYVALRGSNAEAQEHLQRAERLVERHPPGRVFMLLLARQAAQLMMAGRSTECLVTADRAIALADELGEMDWVLGVLQFRGNARVELGDLGGLDDLQESIERSLQAAQAVTAWIGYLNLAGATWYGIGAQQSLELHEQTQAFGESRGLRHGVTWSKAESTWILFDLGRWDEIIAITDELSLDERIGGEQPRTLGLPYRALVLERRGDQAAAAAVLEELLPKARKAADPQLLAPTLAVAALVATARRDGAGVSDFIRELIDLTHGRADRYRALFLAELTGICVQRDDLDLARELAGGMSVDIGRVGAARVAAAAVLTEAEGRTPEALALYEQAATRWREFGGVPGRAEALLGQGRCLITLGRRGAKQRLTEARDLFASMGYKAALAEAESLLERIVADVS
jgi:class 3 adenylate cyclase/tetratricopeptide (TPR) repeat protein